MSKSKIELIQICSLNPILSITFWRDDGTDHTYFYTGGDDVKWAVRIDKITKLCNSDVIVITHDKGVFIDWLFRPK